MFDVNEDSLMTQLLSSREIVADPVGGELEVEANWGITLRGVLEEDDC